jgi:2-oxoglutarate dehydrogenase E1 component
MPDWFNAHPKLVRQFQRRAHEYENNAVDWGLGEAFAFGTVLLEETTVRLAGQDSQRGTFSHRHGVLADQKTGDEYVPLNHLSDGQAPFYIHDSLLSEYAACGFEYGYSVADPSALVIWEAQFGDFANGAQIVFDQFLSSAEEKWAQQSSLVLLLPHGYEGQGPEHSSARLERFLQLCAEYNMSVCALTTPANLFHALRRQVKREARKPLVIMSPKSLLRHPRAISTPDDFTMRGFAPVISASAEPSNARRLVFCSGKLYYDLEGAAENSGRDDVAIIRVEQLYPFPFEDIRRELQRHAHVDDVVWVQEEPMNMGAWSFVNPLFDTLLVERGQDPCAHIKYVGRPERASPSTGSAKVHQLEQERIVETALAI